VSGIQVPRGRNIIVACKLANVHTTMIVRDKRSSKEKVSLQWAGSFSPRESSGQARPLFTKPHDQKTILPAA
jgi:hypothetical protein